jgi:hypothetical protein
MPNITWELPLRTVSEANCSEHWSKKAKRHRQQQFFVRSLFNHEAWQIYLPCIITLTRRSMRFLDSDDNLPMAFKFIKDELSECILAPKRKYYQNKKGAWIPIKGRYDNDPQIIWKYAQEKSKRLGIKIEIDY